MKKLLTPLTCLAGLLTASLLAICLSGCVSGTPLNSNPVGGLLYNTQTNYVPQVQVQTNVIPVTVYHTNEVTLQQTNVQGVTTYTTNAVIVPVLAYQTNTVSVTNQVPQYSNTLKPGVQQGIQGAGSFISTLFPGGGAIAWAIIAALTGLGYFTSAKNSNANYSTAATLAQEIQTLLNFLGALPNGSVYTNVFKTWLAAHQNDADAITKVLDILKNEVSNPNAQIAATQIQQTIQGLLAANATIPPKV